MDILFAPMQGITDCAYRRAHFLRYGGVDAYFAPFARIERGRIRDKERRDILPDRNRDIPTVPQVIARDRDEFARLCDAVQNLGWRQIDLNMGCPFPMQTHAGRGSGLLPHTDRVGEMFDEMRSRPEVAFSIKMRLGLEDSGECMRLLPLINEAPLRLVTMHPRLGMQQYEGATDMVAFDCFLDGCRKPMAYNGDIRTLGDLIAIQRRYPDLAAVMLGRGLVDNPSLARDFKQSQFGAQQI